MSSEVIDTHVIKLRQNFQLSLIFLDIAGIFDQNLNVDMDKSSNNELNGRIFRNHRGNGSKARIEGDKKLINAILEDQLFRRTTGFR